MVVYTDASTTIARTAGAAIGIVIMDGDDRYEAGCRVPQYILDWLRPCGQQINHLEALVLVAARLTFPDVLLGRRVLSFIDNTVALSKSVHGYVNEPDMAAVVNALHVCDAAFGVESWNEWVPSHANVSDLPSREPFDMRRRGARCDEPSSRSHARAGLRPAHATAAFYLRRSSTTHP